MRMHGAARRAENLLLQCQRYWHLTRRAVTTAGRACLAARLRPDVWPSAHSLEFQTGVLKVLAGKRLAGPDGQTSGADNKNFATRFLHILSFRSCPPRAVQTSGRLAASGLFVFGKAGIEPET